jgi:hypothetical protein
VPALTSRLNEVKREVKRLRVKSNYLVSVHLAECLVFRVREQGLRRLKNRSLLA